MVATGRRGRISSDSRNGKDGRGKRAAAERGMRSMNKDKARDLFPGALEMMVLRTLKRQPLHGYALAQHIKRTSNDLLQIEEGSLYPALQRLLKEELVKA